MLVIKHNPRHRFAMVAAFEDTEWSIWPDAAMTAMAVARRFPEEFPRPTGGGRHPRNQYRVAGYGLQHPNWRVCSLLYRIVGIQHYNLPCSGYHTCQIFMIQCAANTITTTACNQVR